MQVFNEGFLIRVFVFFLLSIIELGRNTLPNKSIWVQTTIVPFFIPMFKDRNRMGAVCWRESAGRFHFRAGCAVKKRWLRCSLSRHVHLSKQGAGAGVSGGH